MRVRGLLFAAVIVWLPFQAVACEGPVVVCDQGGVSDFALITNSQPVQVYVAPNDLKGVVRVANDFASDLEKVSGRKTVVVTDASKLSGEVVIIGALGSSTLIDGWVKAKKLKVEAIKGQWEAYSQTVLINPTPKIKKALVITGADKRGAIFGTYDLSARIGVSPWYWWADVPVATKANLFVTAGERHDQPKVKYRGFFINDEEPAFGGWAREKFGGINSKLYAHVFELNLRLMGNYLWPAMWGKAFNDDDPENIKLADDYGVIMGTSHHEPMTRAQDEWHRNKDKGVTGGKWDYTKNADNLRAFWRGGIERMASDGGHETLVTVGMRGDGDEPMSEGTATQLLETIVADQRAIIAEVTKKPASETPQVWALYKEVQDYYDHGMKVPDDVTLLFADDNWGQIRRLPEIGKSRLGGYGIYYHFDYVGGPRNYKWLNTNQIEKVWQQMNLAYESGADRLWIVNVGDIKPMEYPLSFFMAMAWDPKAMTPDALKAYPAKWAGQQFGKEHAREIGNILTRYSQYAARRKPELLNESTYSLENNFEFAKAVSDFGALTQRVEYTAAILPAEQKDAFFQLLQHPVWALSNLYTLYEDVALNRYYAALDDPKANIFADRALGGFEVDKAISEHYHTIVGGKWNHMMSQTHIGYTGWQQPDVDVLPPLLSVDPKAKPRKGGQAPDEVIFEDVLLTPNVGKPFVDTNGYIAIEAEHFARKVDTKGVNWTVIPNLGRTLSSVIAMPQVAPASDLKDGMRLEYDISLSKNTDAELHVYLAPTLDTAGKGGLRLAVSIDDQPPQVLSFDLKPDKPDWNKAVSNNAFVLKASFKGLKAGAHTLKVFRIDGNVVLQKLVLDTGGLKPSYLGPPETPSVR